ncbi:enoyl-CoA hydratase/isomerase family protein [Kibdelosporangium philippinense]|uniref:Enoyl-CoA hydratase/isomerase family protein n=1 Tax=Kibdelosporangium philippinense TaxID=211113 RepID=A0ABS8ZCQ9_9PSEU|nr:enoyl-CoA hydratase/isomerase family protein [Kibdelosporangium philippinense]MCE7005227.1 enoyl-CoA hydratase/isomerase family protein [Kibdelosporangium philippinense]
MRLVQERSDDFLRLKLNRPEQRNAMDEATVAQLLEALLAQPSMPVLLGSTDPTIFSAGADLRVSDAERTRLSDLLYECYKVIISRPGAVIAVTSGAAVGGGAQLAAAADLRISSTGARFRWVGPGHGLAVGAWILPTLVGRSAAMDLLLTSRWLDAEEAHRLGFTALADDPWAAAEQAVAHVAGLVSDAVARIKAVTAMEGLLERLNAERTGNSANWSGAV